MKEEGQGKKGVIPLRTGPELILVRHAEGMRLNYEPAPRGSPGGLGRQMCTLPCLPPPQTHAGHRAGWLQRQAFANTRNVTGGTPSSFSQPSKPFKCRLLGAWWEVLVWEWSQGEEGGRRGVGKIAIFPSISRISRLADRKSVV